MEKIKTKEAFRAALQREKKKRERLKEEEQKLTNIEIQKKKNHIL